MIRKAFGLAVALAFLASFAAPVCPAAAPGASHSCCGGASKKAPSGPAGSCCRQVLPSTAKPALSAPVAALPPCAPIPVRAVAVSPLTVRAFAAVLGAAPPGPTGLSPPARAA